jgi:hypothetical protein
MKTKEENETQQKRKEARRIWMKLQHQQRERWRTVLEDFGYNIYDPKDWFMCDWHIHHLENTTD